MNVILISDPFYCSNKTVCSLWQYTSSP